MGHGYRSAKDKATGWTPGRGPPSAGLCHGSARMNAVSTLRVVGSHGGWRLIDNGRPSFWFLEREQALQIARVIADSRAGLRLIPTSVEAENQAGELELVASYF